MAIEVFNRYENKYVMGDAAFQRLYTRLLEHMEPDEHNRDQRFYTISNIYYDTEQDSLIRTSLAKPRYREKLRIRAYGVPEQDAIVYLELKKKVRGLVNKRRTALALSEAYAFAGSGIAPPWQPYMNRQVVDEIAYLLSRYELHPKVYLAYDRIAMFSKQSRDLRITFDTNIRSRRDGLRLEHGTHGAPLLLPGQWLMEVKAEKTVPLWLARLLSEQGLFRSSFSKYGNEYKRMLQASST